MNSFVYSGMNVYYVTQVLKQRINIKMCLYYIQTMLVIVIIVFKRYPSRYCLMQGSCFICSDF